MMFFAGGTLLPPREQISDCETLSLFDRADLANPTRSEPLFTRESFQALLDKAGTGLTPEGDFHFFEVIEVMGTPYVVALATIWPGIEHDDRTAFVIQFTEHLEPKLVCTLRTKIFGGGQ